jgi:Domain of unknown function (DUF4326)
MSSTNVVNIKGRPKGRTLRDGEVYIGRANSWLGLKTSKWANPFTVRKDGTREECIHKYEDYLRSRPELCDALDELKGKTLACWCSPLPCHGDVLARLAEESGAAPEREQPDDGFFLTEIKDLAAWREEAKTDPWHGLTVVLSDGTRMLAKDVPDD